MTTAILNAYALVAALFAANADTYGDYRAAVASGYMQPSPAFEAAYETAFRTCGDAMAIANPDSPPNDLAATLAARQCELASTAILLALTDDECEALDEVTLARGGWGEVE